MHPLVCLSLPSSALAKDRLHSEAAMAPTDSHGIGFQEGKVGHGLRRGVPPRSRVWRPERGVKGGKQGSTGTYARCLQCIAMITISHQLPRGVQDKATRCRILPAACFPSKGPSAPCKASFSSPPDGPVVHLHDHIAHLDLTLVSYSALRGHFTPTAVLHARSTRTIPTA